MTNGTVVTARPRQLSDSTMDYVIRQTIRGLAGQAGHTEHFFRMHVDVAGWEGTLSGCIERTYEIANVLDELISQAPELQVGAEDIVDPRWEAIDKLKSAGIVLWDKGRRLESLRFGRIADKLTAKAKPLGIEQQARNTVRLRAELDSESDLAKAVHEALDGLCDEKQELDVETLGVSFPYFILADRIEALVYAKDREADFEYADFREIAVEIVPDGAR